LGAGDRKSGTIVSGKRFKFVVHLVSTPDDRNIRMSNGTLWLISHHQSKWRYAVFGVLSPMWWGRWCRNKRRNDSWSMLKRCLPRDEWKAVPNALICLPRTPHCFLFWSLISRKEISVITGRTRNRILCPLTRFTFIH
jgi:hypothetical protein